ncbi:hypothetical protein MMC24_004657 [Lignoscripta atroalba]|nr:hypothetical protein [Lignoscripta atroalba]
MSNSTPSTPLSHAEKNDMYIPARSIRDIEDRETPEQVQASDDLDLWKTDPASDDHDEDDQAVDRQRRARKAVNTDRGEGTDSYSTPTSSSYNDSRDTLASSIGTGTGPPAGTLAPKKRDTQADVGTTPLIAARVSESSSNNDKKKRRWKECLGRVKRAAREMVSGTRHQGKGQGGQREGLEVSEQRRSGEQQEAAATAAMAEIPATAEAEDEGPPELTNFFGGEGTPLSVSLSDQDAWEEGANLLGWPEIGEPEGIDAAWASEAPAGAPLMFLGIDLANLSLEEQIPQGDEVLEDRELRGGRVWWLDGGLTDRETNGRRWLPPRRNRSDPEAFLF